MAKQLMSGNQVIARVAWEAGVVFAASYPGTPATEILESLAHYAEIHVQWSVNEKDAIDEAMGAAIAGVRAFDSMKQVGINVVADSFMVFHIQAQTTVSALVRLRIGLLFPVLASGSILRASRT